MAEAIVRIAGRGDGVTADGRHVAFTAPGDTVADDGAITPGPHRQVPPCRHFPRCGGCQLQHIDDDAYRGFLHDRIAGAIVAQGLAVPPMRSAHLSPSHTRRRAALRAERTGNTVAIGFNEQASHRIIDMRECHILAPELFALVAPLRELLRPLLAKRGQASVQLTLADGGVDLVLEKVTIEGLAATEALADFAQAHGLARLSIDEGFGAEPRYEPQPACVTLGGVAVPLPPGGFLQATADGEAALVAAVRDAIGDAIDAADLFAGLGTFALGLGDGVRVLAVEGARDAALALKGAAARAGRSVSLEHRDLFRRPLTAAELATFDAIILDPPRAGAREQMPALAKSGVARIAYVSCNPGTFARDAAMLVAGGYRLAWVQPVGQFRWSTHVELVGAFVR